MNQCCICGGFSKKNLCMRCIKRYTRYAKYKIFKLKAYKKTTKSQNKLYSQLKLAFNKKHVLVQEVVFDWYPFKRYDIVDLTAKVIYEYDGIQHFKFIKFFHKSRQEFLRYKLNDRAKMQVARSYGYKVIRFNYLEDIHDLEYIKNKLIKFRVL